MLDLFLSPFRVASRLVPSRFFRTSARKPVQICHEKRGHVPTNARQLASCTLFETVDGAKLVAAWKRKNSPRVSASIASSSLLLVSQNHPSIRLVALVAFEAYFIMQVRKETMEIIRNRGGRGQWARKWSAVAAAEEAAPSSAKRL